jgi:hypothetical protein
MFHCYKEILTKKRSLSHQRTMHDFFKSSSGTCASTPILMDMADDNPDDPPTVQEKVLPP